MKKVFGAFEQNTSLRAEHEICPANKLLTTANYFLLNTDEHEKFSANKLENANCIFIFVNREHFMLSRVEHKKCSITSGPECSLN